MALERPRFPLHKEIVKMTFEQFMHFGVGTALDNGMTRMICGCDLDTVPYGQCTPDMLKKAKENIKKYFLIGLTERFEESLIYFKQVLGWQTLPTYKNYNITNNKPADVRISDETLHSIEKHINLDQQLYKFCADIFDSRIKEFDDSFFEQVEVLKKMNHQPNKGYRLK